MYTHSQSSCTHLVTHTTTAVVTDTAPPTSNPQQGVRTGTLAVASARFSWETITKWHQNEPMSPTVTGAIKFAFLLAVSCWPWEGGLGRGPLVLFSLPSRYAEATPPGIKSPWMSEFRRVWASSGLWLNERRNTLSPVLARRNAGPEPELLLRRKLRDRPGAAADKPVAFERALIPLLIDSFRLRTSSRFSSAVLGIGKEKKLARKWIRKKPAHRIHQGCVVLPVKSLCPKLTCWQTGNSIPGVQILRCRLCWPAPTSGGCLSRHEIKTRCYHKLHNNRNAMPWLHHLKK